VRWQPNRARVTHHQSSQHPAPARKASRPQANNKVDSKWRYVSHQTPRSEFAHHVDRAKHNHAQPPSQDSLCAAPEPAICTAVTLLRALWRGLSSGKPLLPSATAPGRFVATDHRISIWDRWSSMRTPSVLFPPMRSLPGVRMRSGGTTGHLHRQRHSQGVPPIGRIIQLDVEQPEPDDRSSTGQSGYRVDTCFTGVPSTAHDEERLSTPQHNRTVSEEAFARNRE
jgi:hypothetical protein